MPQSDYKFEQKFYENYPLSCNDCGSEAPTCEFTRTSYDPSGRDAKCELCEYCANTIKPNIDASIRQTMAQMFNVLEKRIKNAV